MLEDDEFCGILSMFLIRTEVRRPSTARNEGGGPGFIPGAETCTSAVDKPSFRSMSNRDNVPTDDPYYGRRCTGKLTKAVLDRPAVCGVLACGRWLTEYFCDCSCLMCHPPLDLGKDWSDRFHYEGIGSDVQIVGPDCRRTHKGRSGRRVKRTVVGTLVCAAILWIAAKGANLPSRNHVARPLELLADERTATGHGAESSRGEVLVKDPKVRVSNIYHRDSETSSNLTMYPWDHVAEPHHATLLEVLQWRVEDWQELGFRWEVEGQVVGIGPVIETEFERPGVYNCTVTSFDSAREGSSTRRDSGVHVEGDADAKNASPASVSNVITSFSFSVVVKYVRREIRELNDRHREELFNAISIMQRVPSAVGQEVYGKTYYSKAFFDRLHLYYAGHIACDHWHDGTGFAAAHIALELMFEQSLQAINPRIALAYWDFTVEGTLFNSQTFRNSSVFSDDWFGDAAPDNDLRITTRGRFAYVPTMANAREYSEVHNAYGLLRAPWNNDPVPFMTRSDHLHGRFNNRKPAGCKEYRDSIMQHSWMDLARVMNFDAHGHIHELLGGTWSPDEDEYANRTTNIVFPFLHVLVPYVKRMWRAGYLMCPEDCDASVPWSECHCTCQLDSSDKDPGEILADAGILSVGFFYDKDMNLIQDLAEDDGSPHTSIPGYTREETMDIYKELLRVVCLPMKMGTHYEAASTNDVTFWFIHPTYDRLWHLSRLEKVPDFDDSWVTESPCYGHNPLDIQPFHGLFLGEDAPATNKFTASGVPPVKSYYTNLDLYDKLRPDAMELPYVYDNFAWPHCQERGIFVRGADTSATNYPNAHS